MAESSTFKQHCFELLSKTSVTDIKQPAKIVQFDLETPLVQAFEALLSNNILSAPVYDPSTGKYVGFLDCRDIVTFVVSSFEQNKVHDNTELACLIKNNPDKTLKDFATKHEFVPVSKTDSLYKVAELLAKPGVHRVPIIEDGKLIGLVTQSALIAFIANRLSQEMIRPNEADPTITELGIGSKPVLAIDWNSTVIDTFRLMEAKGRSGVALIDGQERLVGTTTGKDLGLFIKNPTIAALRSEIFQYTKQIRQGSIEIKAPLIAVFEKDRLPRAVGLLAATKVHRVFVVDGDSTYKVVSVISITDILTHLVSK